MPLTTKVWTLAGLALALTVLAAMIGLTGAGMGAGLASALAADATPPLPPERVAQQLDVVRLLLVSTVAVGVIVTVGLVFLTLRRERLRLERVRDGLHECATLARAAADHAASDPRESYSLLAERLEPLARDMDATL